MQRCSGFIERYRYTFRYRDIGNVILGRNMEMAGIAIGAAKVASLEG
jgi:hypothetical protein